MGFCHHFLVFNRQRQERRDNTENDDFFIFMFVAGKMMKTERSWEVGPTDHAASLTALIFQNIFFSVGYLLFCSYIFIYITKIWNGEKPKN